jgi:hypothetical protein
MFLLTPYEVISKEASQLRILNLSVQVPRDVTHFSGLASVIEGLQSLDGLLRTKLDRGGSVARNNELLEVRAKLVRFRVNSDPLADLIANHPWLSVLTLVVVVVRDYERFRNSLAAMKEDAGTFAAGIVGLAKAEQELVVFGVSLIVDELAQFSNGGLKSWVERLNRARNAITGPNDERPTVRVRETDV